MTTILVRDLRRAGVGNCPVAKAWAKKHGIAWRELREGLDADRIRNIEDGQTMIRAVIKAAEEREASERGR